MQDQLAGVENEGKVSIENQFVKKCLKAVVFVCRIIPSLHVYLINECKKENILHNHRHAVDSTTCANERKT